MARVATAYVAVRPDMDGFKERLTAELDRISASVTVEITPDMPGFKQNLDADLKRVKPSVPVQLEQAGLDDLKREITVDLERMHPSVTVDVEQAGLREVKTEIEEQTARMHPDVTVDVKVDQKGLRREADTAARSTDKVMSRAGRRAGKSWTDGFAKTMKTGMSLKLGQMAPIIGGIAIATAPLADALSGISAAATGVGVALTGAAMGGGAALLGTFAAIGQSAVGLKGVLQGVGDALEAQSAVSAAIAADVAPSEADEKKLEKAMKRLSPAGKELVKMAGQLTVEWTRMGKSVQQIALVGVATQMRTLATGYMPMVRTAMQALATTTHDTIGEFAGFLKQTSTMRQVGTIMSANTEITRQFAAVLLPLARAGLTLYTAFLPLIRVFALMATNAATTFAAWVQGSAESGRLTRLVTQLTAAFKSVWSIALNLGRIVANVFNAALTPGQSLLDMLADLIQRFADWTASAKGQNVIRDWVNASIPLIKELGGLIGDIGKMFGGLAKAGDATAMVASLRSLLAPLGELLTQLSAPAAVSPIVDALTSITDSLVAMNAGGILQQVITDLARFLDIAADLVTTVPGGTKVMGAFVTVMAGWKAVQLGASLTGLRQLPGVISNINQFQRAMRGLEAGGTGAKLATNLQKVASVAKNMGGSLLTAGRNAAVAGIEFARFAAQQVILGVRLAATRIALLAQQAAMLVVRGAIIAWTAVQWLLNAALTANPIGILVVAIGALVAGLIIAYKKSDTFRAIVNAAFGAITDAARTLWRIVRPIFVAFGTVAKTYFGMVYTVAKTYFGLVKTFITTAVKLIKAVLTGNFSAIPKIIGDGFSKAYGLVKSAWSKIKSAISAGIGSAIDYVKTIPGKLTKALGNMGSLLYDMGADVVRGLFNGIKSMGGWITSELKSWVTDHIPGPIRSVLKMGSPSRLMYEMGQDIARPLATGMESQQAQVEGAAMGLADAATLGVSAVTDAYADLMGTRPLTFTRPAYAGTGLAGTRPNINTSVRVYIGDRDITDIVRIVTTAQDETNARTLLAGQRG